MFLSCITVPANWRPVFDLEIPSWLLLDGTLCIILLIVGDSVCLSLKCETEAEFLVIALVGRPLKAKNSGDITSFGFKLIFCSCSVVSLFLLILLKKVIHFLLHF